ncbi:HAMP domain-containing methyl-accepting chemotaxis protein [Bacillus sp. REN3]|uniref:methyl-accepting chemotaxis protein n=1 Tax=Bacillus sp. REN3 TaxID=2802440 RepID=UPI001AEEB067|nr:HAMP domain-containing methyl-accepting chemotaxis protein [Bacillus sp. REN3]
MRGLRDLSLKTKVFTFFGLLFVVYAASTIYNFFLLNQFGRSSDPSGLISKSIYSTAAAGTVITLGCLVFITILFKNVFKPIDQLTKATQKIVHGDLTGQLESQSNDEIGQLTAHFNSMISQLRSLVGQCQKNTEVLHDSARMLYGHSQDHQGESKKIVASVSQVSAGAEKQQEHSHKLERIIQDMAERIGEIANLANGIEGMSADNAVKSEAGMVLIRETGNQVVNMNSITAKATYDAEQLAEKTNKIDDIVNLISGIANQTNLLALNAAIEAARAGEQGKGFAVVAGEVRALAEKSIKASKEIQETVVEVRSEIKRLAEIIAGGRLEVEKGSKLFGEVELQYEDMRNGVISIQEEIGRVANAASEMDRQTAELTSMKEETAAILKMNGTGIDEMAAGVEKQGAAIIEILRTAEGLKEVSSVLKASVSAYRNA